MKRPPFSAVFWYLWGSNSPNFSAGNLYAGVAGRLGGKVIHTGVDDDDFPQNVPQGEAVCEKG